ncbi:MAG: hypothetical protein QOF24_1172 [Verrucomicrobiota bacterium]|jgi:hypothetical protein
MDENIQIANWAVEISFIGTTVGNEISVANALSATDGATQCNYFTTFGYFDLAAVRCIERLNSSYLVLLHPEVTESAPFRFFADCNTSKEKFAHALTSWNLAIAVVAKIRAWNSTPQGNERWAAADLLQKTFPECFVFFGLGFSELLLMTGGDDLSSLLRQVGQIRSIPAPESQTRALFDKTTTFPFISCRVLEGGNYEGITGHVEPVITVACAPSSERTIAAALREKNIIAKNVYGKNDLLLAWREQISISDLANFLSEFRSTWGRNGTVRKTTTYLETSLDESPTAIVSERQSVQESISATDEEELFAKLRMVEPYSLRAGLSDLVLRLMTCLRDPQLAPYYQDMVNTLEFVQNIVEELRSSDDLASKEAEAAAARVAHTARSAINQRYAALELHPETLALPILLCCATYGR